MSQQINSTTEKQKWFLSAVFLCLLGAIVAAALLALPLLAEPGLLNTRGGGDSPFLLQRLHQLETALQDGHFPVRWMPDANYGYGYPFYNFYAPLSIYSAVVFRFLGFPFVRAIQLSQLAGFVVAAWGMFALVRRWFGSPWAGLLASVAYSTAPFHMINVYVRGDSLAEFWAMAFYPLVLLTADWLIELPLRRHVALFALAYAALILSHNISALIFSPFLLLYLLLRWWFQLREPDKVSHYPLGKSILWLIGGLGLALALAAWFFVPALAEQSLAQLGPVTEGYFHFSNHFRGVNLVQTFLAFDYSVDGGNAFRMGLVQVITAVSGLIILLFWRKEGAISLPIKLFILLGFGVATFMMTPLSRLLWEYLPLLSFTQFPWRFLSVQAFVAALATGGLALLPGRRWLVPILSIALLLAALGNLHTDHLRLTDADVTARKLAEYEWYSGNIGSTVSAEYLPQTVQPRPVTSAWLNGGSRDSVTVLAGAADVMLLERKAIHQRWSVTATDETTLVFPTMAWPGWLVELDRQQIDFEPAAGSGLIQMTLPAGEHEVALRLARTPVRLVAEWVSLTAVLLLIFLLFPRHWHLPSRKWGAGLVALLLLFVVATLWPEQQLSDTDLNWDFAQMGYLHHEKGCILFTDSLCLEAYQYNDNTLEAGETLTVETQWSGAALASAPEATLALYSPAITRPPIVAEVEPPAIATASELLAGERTFTLTLADDVPPGLYVPRLVVDGRQPLTPSGLSRGDLFLRPVQILAKDGVSIVAHGNLDATVITSDFREADSTLDLHMAWFTEQPLTPNYNVSLRLMDAQGQWLRQLDTQPGFGFLPSSGWVTGDWTPDWLALRLPDLDPAADPYPLLVQLYAVAAPEVPVLTRRLGTVQAENTAWSFQVNEPNFELPIGIGLGKKAETAVFDDEIQLLAYEVAQDADSATLTLYWQALANGQTDYTRFVQLLGAEPGQPPLAQNDSYPVFNSYPTGQWLAGEVVADTVTLDLIGLPVGEYDVVTGFYERLADGGLERLTAVDGVGNPLPDDILKITTLKIED